MALLTDDELSKLMALPIDHSEERRKQLNDMVVVEANDLIDKARHQLTAREMKIMDFLAAQLQPTDTKFHTIKVNIAELSEAIHISKGGRQYKQVASSLFALVTKPVTILSTDNKGKRRLTRTNWLAQATVVEDGSIEADISSQLSEYLLNLDGRYTQHLFRDTAKLHSRYAIILYKLMREAQGVQGHINRENGTNIAATIGTGKGQGTPQWWKERLGIDAKQPTAYITRVLNKAINEIHTSIDLDGDMVFNKPEKVYQGHRIAKIYLSELTEHRY